MSASGDDKPDTEDKSKAEVKENEAASPPPAEVKKSEEKKEHSDNIQNLQKESLSATPVENGDVKTGSGSTDKSEPSPTVSSGSKPIGFKERFKQFSKFGDTKSDGKMITLSQSDKWMKQAKVIDKKITITDTGIYFKKFKMQKIPLSDYEKFLEDLAKNKKVELEEIKKKMIECGAPGLSGPSGSAAKGSQSAVERLTDVTKYTGSHKQRFDESGKGKGIAGRRDTPDKSGYVQGYQNKDSYSKTH